MRWEIQKNKIDLQYQRDLQKYQVFLAASYAVPLTLFGIIIQTGISSGNMLVAITAALLSFNLLQGKVLRMEAQLEEHLGQVEQLGI